MDSKTKVQAAAAGRRTFKVKLNAALIASNLVNLCVYNEDGTAAEVHTGMGTSVRKGGALLKGDNGKQFIFENQDIQIGSHGMAKAKMIDGTEVHLIFKVERPINRKDFT